MVVVSVLQPKINSHDLINLKNCFDNGSSFLCVYWKLLHHAQPHQPYKQKNYQPKTPPITLSTHHNMIEYANKLCLAPW